MSTSTPSTPSFTENTSGKAITSTDVTTSGTTSWTTRWTTHMMTSDTTSLTSTSTSNQTTGMTSYITVYSSTIAESAYDNAGIIAGATVGTFLALAVLAAAGGVCWWKRRALSIAISKIRSRRAMDKSVRSGTANEYVEAADVESGEPRHNPVTRVATPVLSANIRYYVNVPDSNGNLVYEAVDLEFPFNDIEEGSRGVSLEHPTRASKGCARLDDHTECKGSEESLYSNVCYSGVTESVGSATLRSKDEADYCEIIPSDSVRGLESRDRDLKCDSYIQCDSFVKRDADINIPDQTALEIPDTQCELSISDYLSLCGETLSLYPSTTNDVSSLSTDANKVLESKPLNEYEALSGESISTEVLVNKQTDSNKSVSCGLTHLLEILSNKSIHFTDVLSLELTHSNFVLSNDSAHQNGVISNESAQSTELLYKEPTHSTEDFTNVPALSTEVLSNESTQPNEVLSNESTHPTEVLSIETSHQNEVLSNAAVHSTEVLSNESSQLWELFSNESTQSSDI